MSTIDEMLEEIRRRLKELGKEAEIEIIVKKIEQDKFTCKSGICREE